MLIKSKNKKHNIIFNAMHIGTNIRKLRKAHGLSQTQLARNLNTTTKAISDYETGKANPPSNRLPVIAKFFSVTLDELMDEEEIKISVSEKDKMKHGNSREVKLLSLFKKLSDEEQRTILKQIQGLVDLKRKR